MYLRPFHFTLFPPRNIRAFHLDTDNIFVLPAAMRPLTTSAGSALRTWTRHSLPSQTTRHATPSLTAALPKQLQQRRQQQTGAAGAPHSVSTFDSPYGRTSEAEPVSAKIPSFKAYMSRNSETTNRVFQYFMVGTMGMLAAAGAKATVQGMEETHISIFGSECCRNITQNFATDLSGSFQIFSSICPPQPMCWPWPK